MEDRPAKEFGKRIPAVIPSDAAQPVKRSRHVALLVMGTLAVGGGAFAMMPREGCPPPPPTMGEPPPERDTSCARRSSSGTGFGRSTHFGFFSGDNSSRPSSSTSSESSFGSVVRGGFGSFARALGFSGRG
jgi:hypothetical protein